MSLRDYVVRSDKFEPALAIGLSFPCMACIHSHKPENSDPCNACGHNLTAIKLDEKEDK